MHSYYSLSGNRCVPCVQSIDRMKQHGF